MTNTTSDLAGTSPLLTSHPTETQNGTQGVVIHMSSLCGASNQPFFNQTQSWDTSDPDISSCFRKTI